MPDETNATFTRREVLVAGAVGTAALAALPGISGAVASGAGGAASDGAASGGAASDGAASDGAASGGASAPSSGPEGERTTASGMRMPVAFLPHGGGPWPFVDLGLPKSEVDDLKGYLRSVRALPKAAPKALLVISAHWEERVPTVMTSPRPPMLYDYYGFPKASYELSWPAPGAPDVADRVQALLEGAGIESARDEARGFDHGTFVPLMLTYPDADVPTLQLSLKKGLDPEEHLAIGRALAPLRDEGVFLLGSGMTFHNLRAIGRPEATQISEVFDAWLRESATLPAKERARRLVEWARAPGARAAHPREEHLLPLMVIAGAAGDDDGKVAWGGSMLGWRLSAYHYG